MNKWLLVTLFGLGGHFGASYLVPLDDKAKQEFGGLLKWFWPWSQGDSGPLGVMSAAGFPIIGFYIAVTSAVLFFMAALAVLGLWVPLSWLKFLVISASALCVLVMVLFFGPTKIIPILFSLFLIWFAWNNKLYIK